MSKLKFFEKNERLLLVFSKGNITDLELMLNACIDYSTTRSLKLYLFIKESINLKSKISNLSSLSRAPLQEIIMMKLNLADKAFWKFLVSIRRVKTIILLSSRIVCGKDVDVGTGFDDCLIEHLNFAECGGETLSGWKENPMKLKLIFDILGKYDQVKKILKRVEVKDANISDYLKEEIFLKNGFKNVDI
jgi:hypothetical protein